ncbi:hypothetical protein E2C01_067856 [Portunus trituberculatus]|uniref:Uncharacterized protein n=1 Tax=Portunus trituberculatus TaxID=210409 RepID=A0A5B7HU60_PORTR|nr:hypothetical protein [Portunus trituberculatus]
MNKGGNEEQCNWRRKRKRKKRRRRHKRKRRRDGKRWSRVVSNIRGKPTSKVNIETPVIKVS